MKAIPTYKTQNEVEDAFKIIKSCKSKAAAGLLLLFVIVVIKIFIYL